MSMPFYVSPEQLMKDRADFARKGIARGRSVVVIQFADGILFVAENQSQALHKISEIYDRLAFAAVGRYNEFENLRIAGVRMADVRGDRPLRPRLHRPRLAAGLGRPGLLVAAFLQAREKLEHALHVAADLASVRALERAHLEVLRHRHPREEAPPFR